MGPGDPLPLLVAGLKRTVIQRFSPLPVIRFREEFQYFDELTSISEKLRPGETEASRRTLMRELTKLGERYAALQHACLPTNPLTRVLRAKPDTAMVLKAHAHVPFIVTFEAVLNHAFLAQPQAAAAGRPSVPGAVAALIRQRATYAAAATHHRALKAAQAAQAVRPGLALSVVQATPQQQLRPHPPAAPSAQAFERACIFKIDDDTRQDILALQVIHLFRSVFRAIGLGLFLYPYRVIATAPERGAIEVIRDASSRHDLGRTTEGSLVDLFANTYGSPASATFLQARENFIRSMAAYSIVSFILQVKDRHNGNIMLDHAGHIIHIDFGFMLNNSPGGEIKFERAPFKLSTEMIQLMGGTPTAEPYVRFVNYVSKGYLAIRPYADDVVALCALMSRAGLPCFKPSSLRLDPVHMVPDVSFDQASTYIRARIDEFHEKPTTLGYDRFQRWQNGIEF